MQWFYNMRIGTKLISAFIIVALIAGIVGAVGTININKINKDYSFNYDKFGVPLENIGLVGVYFHKNRTVLRDIVYTDDRSAVDGYIQTIKENDDRILQELDIFARSATTEDMEQLINNLRTYIANYNSVRDQIIEDSLAGNRDAAISGIAEAYEVTTLTDHEISNILDLKNVSGQKLKAEIQEQATETITMMIVIIAVAIIVAIVLGVLIARSLSGPIKQIVSGAERIAAGDLDVQIPVKSRDELGKLASAFGQMTDNLNEVMSNIAAASEQVASGAKQMSESSVILSQGATEQASSIEQLTASLEEITAKINENSTGANEAARVSTLTKNEAISGDEQMRSMLIAMDEINASSDSISKIIKVIDEIAFQTNILALNAAVEAARAGQHGKGFAVVAEEVRNLAARSANAAKETAEMIEGSIRKVEDGMKIANQTAEALQGIVKSITEINEISNLAAANAKEQAVGVAQINQGLVQVSQVIQTNSATSEENAAASEELTSQAETLKQQVGRFKLRRSYNQSFRYGYDQMNANQRLSSDDKFADKIAELDAITLDDHDFGKY